MLTAGARGRDTITALLHVVLSFAPGMIILILFNSYTNSYVFIHSQPQHSVLYVLSLEEIPIWYGIYRVKAA